MYSLMIRKKKFNSLNDNRGPRGRHRDRHHEQRDHSGQSQGEEEEEEMSEDSFVDISRRGILLEVLACT